jgi:hypothetical protein
VNLTQPNLLGSGSNKVAALIDRHNQSQGSSEQKLDASESKIPEDSPTQSQNKTTQQNRSRPPFPRDENMVMALHDCEGEAGDELTF